MRIASFFLKAFVTIGLLVLFLYFVVGPLWLAFGSQSFISNVRRLEDLSTDMTVNARTCQQAPAASNYSRPKAVQLRFIDNQSYVLELICSLIETTPVRVGEGKLPYLISKAPGASGFYIDFSNPQPSTLTLKSLRATKEFTFSGGLLPAGQKATGEMVTTLPQTACAGWGYQCCQTNSETGVGAGQTTGVLDCPGNCFAACAPRPYLVSFVSDPYPSAANEVLMDSSSLTVTFSYTAEVTGGTISQVEIDYGDGASETSQEPTGVFTHSYTCNGPCRYGAKIKASDSSGNSSVATDISTIYIVKR